jgi:SAM-dependent methyltransferase
MAKIPHEQKAAWDKLYSKKGLQYGGTGELSLLWPRLDPNMLCLDVGCGDGKTAEALSRACEVTGCDFSREALMSLRSQRDPERLVNLVQCDLMSLPFEPEKFDTVVCVHVLSHLRARERERGAEEVSRVLKQQGMLYLEVFGRGDLRCGDGAQAEPSSFIRGNGILTHYFAEDELLQLFGGLDHVSSVTSIKRVTYGAISGKRELLRVLLRKH